MATNFPASLDSLTNPTSSDSLNSPSHSAQHANVNDAVEALQAKVGADSSAVTSSHDYKIAQLEARAGTNLVYNGAMQVAQRGLSVAGITATGYYTADRWQHTMNALGTWTQSVENDAPTGSGFRNSLKILCTTADAAPAANDFCLLQQILEGRDMQPLCKGTVSAKQVTLSFWVKSNVTGTYIVELRDQDNSRQVSASYSVVASGTWEKKTITFPADTSGVLDNDGNDSLRLAMWLASGSNFTSGALNTVWGSDVAANRAVGQTNLAAATSNYWQITGVQLEIGNQATAFDHLPYGVELARCQRYYFLLASGNSKQVGIGSYFNTSNIQTTVYFPVSMRTEPSAAIASGTNYYRSYFGGGTNDLNSFILRFANLTSCELLNNSEASGTTGYATSITTNSASASIAFTAEL